MRPEPTPRVLWAECAGHQRLAGNAAAAGGEYHAAGKGGTGSGVHAVKRPKVRHRTTSTGAARRVSISLRLSAARHARQSRFRSTPSGIRSPAWPSVAFSFFRSLVDITLSPHHRPQSADKFSHALQALLPAEPISETKMAQSASSEQEGQQQAAVRAPPDHKVRERDLRFRCCRRRRQAAGTSGWFSMRFSD